MTRVKFALGKRAKRPLMKHEKYEDDGKTSVPMTVFNIDNYIFGTVLLSTPFALLETGFGLGIFIIMVILIVSVYTSHLLIHDGVLTKTESYQDLGRAAFGRPGFVLIGLLQISGAIIGLIAYLIFIGDNMSKLLIRFSTAEDIEELRSHFWGSRPFVVVLPLIIALPLSLYRSVGFLSKWSLFSIVAILLTLIFMSIRLATLDLPRTVNAFKFANKDFAQGIAIFALAFMIHDCEFLFYGAMRTHTESAWRQATNHAYMLAALFAVSIGIVGFTTFTGNVQGNIFENYCSSDDLINAARFVFSLNVLLSIPTSVILVRKVIEHTVFAKHQPSPLYRHVLLTFVIAGIAYGLTLTIECLGFIAEVNGIVAAIPLVFILPPLILLKVQDKPLKSKENIPVILTLVFGIVIFLVGLVVTIREIISGEVGCLAGEEPAFCATEDFLTTVAMTTV